MHNDPTESEPTFYKNPYESSYGYGPIPMPPPPPKHYSIKELVLEVVLVLLLSLMIFLIGLIVFMLVHSAIPPLTAPT